MSCSIGYDMQWDNFYKSISVGSLLRPCHLLMNRVNVCQTINVNAMSNVLCIRLGEVPHGLEYAYDRQTTKKHTPIACKTFKQRMYIGDWSVAYIAYMLKILNMSKILMNAQQYITFTGILSN